MSKKRIYSLEDLYNLISSNKVDYNFNSDKTGYQLSVQVPAQFEVMKENGDDSLLFCKVKLMHSGENRNHSNVTDNALTKASKTLAYKPILANFMEYTDENGETLKDFTSHDMELNEDGTTTYFEKQVGCFTSDDPYFEVEEDTGHNFLYGYCAIPVGYTDAASIIERKGGTKVSVELAVNELSYNVETTKGIIPVSWQVTNGTLNLSETNGHVTSGYVHIDIGFLKDLLTAQHISDALSDNQVVVYIPRDQELDTFSCQMEEGDLKLDAMNCRNFTFP